MKNIIRKDARIAPVIFVAALLLRLLACNGNVVQGSGGNGGQAGSGGQGGSGGLPDPPAQKCAVADDCMWPPSVCVDKTTELDYVMPTCGTDGTCQWVKQTYPCMEGDCVDGSCPVITDTAGGSI